MKFLKPASKVFGGITTLALLAGTGRFVLDAYKSSVEFNQATRDAKMAILRGEATASNGSPKPVIMTVDGKPILLSVTTALNDRWLLPVFTGSRSRVISQYCANVRLSRLSATYPDRWTFKHGGHRDFTECWAVKPKHAPLSRLLINSVL